MGSTPTVVDYVFFVDLFFTGRKYKPSVSINKPYFVLHFFCEVALHNFVWKEISSSTISHIACFGTLDRTLLWEVSAL